jgi:hypothetical protein
LRFFHRANQDGSFDTICYRCLIVVAAEKKEIDLDRFEQEHVCEPRLIADFAPGLPR